MTDKKTLHIFSASLLSALLLALCLPLGESGRIVAAILLLPAAILLPFFVKKRGIPSIHQNQVLLLLTVMALIIVMLYYLTGLKFGFYQNLYRLTAGNFLKFFLPIAIIIGSTEVIRYILMAQNSKPAKVMCYFSCLIADLLIVSNIAAVSSFNKFMDLVVGALFPAIISNLLYNYLSKRYGMYPNIAYRAITTLHLYTFSVRSGVSESLLHFFELLLPIAIFFFIDALYEKKRRYALGNTSRVAKITSGVLTAVLLIGMAGSVMLISNQFRFGLLVVATPSMTGELNQGDAAIFQKIDDHPIEEGQVIVFEKNNSLIIHRVVDIQTINGTTRYYTKGDANEDIDSGYVTRASVVGFVNYKIPYIGYPTIWLRSLFKR